MTHHVLTDILQDSMNLNRCVVHLDPVTNLYLLQIGDIPLHKVITSGCDVATFPILLNDENTLYYPQEIADIYLFTNMDNQLLLTYNYYYGKKTKARELGNVPLPMLKDELTHIVDNNLSNIVSHCVKPDSYLVDLTLDHNIDVLIRKHAELVTRHAQGTATNIANSNHFSQMMAMMRNQSLVLTNMLTSLNKFTGRSELDSEFVTNVKLGGNIAIPQVARQNYQTMISNIPAQKITAHATLVNEHISSKQAFYLSQKTKFTEYNLHTNSIDQQMYSKTSEFRTLYVNNILSFDSILSDPTKTIILFDPSIQNYDPSHIIRFNGVNGSIIIFVPINNDAVTHGYKVRTKFNIANQHNYNERGVQTCDLCTVAFTNAMLPIFKYKLGITNLSKSYALVSGIISPSAIAVENINGQSYYMPLDPDGEERILSFPYSHAPTHQPCDDATHNTGVAFCGLHTYYNNAIFTINDRMLFDMLESLQVALLYAQQKYNKRFTIGPLKYDFRDGTNYTYVRTGVPTIYPVFHLYSNSVGHMHLHTWICPNGDRLSQTLSVGTSDICDVNISMECAGNVFGNETLPVTQTIAPSNPDPSYEGGSFEYAFKKMLGIKNNSTLITRKLIFDEPDYDLHANCFVTKKQEYVALNMALVRQQNKINYATNISYAELYKTIPNMRYKIRDTQEQTTIVRTNCRKPMYNNMYNKKMILLLLELVTPQNSNIVGYFTRTTPIYTNTVQRELLYVKHPEICIISPMSSDSAVVNNSKFTTCNNVLTVQFIQNIVTSICAYHKMYSITVTQREINIGKLWVKICTSISEYGPYTTHNITEITNAFGRQIVNNVSNVRTDFYQFGGIGATSVESRKNTHSFSIPSHDHKTHSISNNEKIKQIHNNRHTALSMISEKDLAIFVEKHNRMFDNDGDVDIIFDHDDTITINARELCVNELTFIHKMKTLLMYHRRMDT